MLGSDLRLQGRTEERQLAEIETVSRSGNYVICRKMQGAPARLAYVQHRAAAQCLGFHDFVME